MQKKIKFDTLGRGASRLWTRKGSEVTNVWGCHFCKGNMSPNRSFKVMQPLCNGTGAHLRFRGQWLLKAGFHPGQTFKVINPAPGVIHLEINGPVQLTDKDFITAIERLDAVMQNQAAQVQPKQMTVLEQQ